jgi:SAM-dependent methyltransferase
VTALAFEDRPCPICRSADRSRVFAPSSLDPARLDGMSFSSRKAPEGMHLRLLECTTCDLLYASPAPSAESLGIAYRDAQYDSSIESRYAAETYAQILAGMPRDLSELGGAVDIGAGDGAFLARLRDAGFDPVVGFEPSSAPLAAASPAIRAAIRAEPFRAGVLPASAFGLVTCLQTIEHVPDPQEVCRDALRVLAPSGALLVVCHDRRALAARILGRRSPIFDVEHVQLFSAQSVRALLERCGFEGVHVRPLANRYPLSYWARLAPLPSRGRGLALTALERVRLGNVPVTLRPGNLVAIGYRPA